MYLNLSTTRQAAIKSIVAMKIVGIRTHILKSELSQPFAFSQGWVPRRSATLVEVQTDSEPRGWGGAFAQGLEAPDISATAVEHALTPLARGADPLDIEVLWHRMYHATDRFEQRNRNDSGWPGHC